MGNGETVTPSKPDKASSPVQEQPVVHPYPDWAAMQAYYGPGVPMPPTYFNATVAPGHPPHPYMWSAQPMMPPFPAPYPAIYPPGIFSHPSMATQSAIDVPAKSSNSKDRGLMKKLKGFDGLAVSIGNVNAEITVGDGSGQSQSSGDNGAEGSSDASDENNASGGKENHKKRSSEDTPASGDRKTGSMANTVHGRETSATPDVPKGVAVGPAIVTGKPMCTLPTHSQVPVMELRASATSQPKAGVHHELWTQDERELKRERRKQSNRESARRSRLRKQAETEELALKVETLGAENSSLRSEISKVKESSEKLRAENSSLLEKLKNVQDNSTDNTENQEATPMVVENFLSRIDELRQEDNHDNSNGGNLHQLLDSSPCTDAVAAG